MKEYLEQRNYPNSRFTYKESEGESHNSEVPKALEMILPWLALQ